MLWKEHVARVRTKHPDMPFKQVLQLASKSYSKSKKKQGAGSDFSTGGTFGQRIGKIREQLKGPMTTAQAIELGKKGLRYMPPHIEHKYMASVDVTTSQDEVIAGALAESSP